MNLLTRAEEEEEEEEDQEEDQEQEEKEKEEEEEENPHRLANDERKTVPMMMYLPGAGVAPL